jgi:hypothetical protein
MQFFFLFNFTKSHMQHNSNRTIDFLFMKELTKNRKIENRNNTVIVINHYDVIFFPLPKF